LANTNTQGCDSFANAARARIQWLEGIIRGNLPDIDLNEGPQVDIISDPRQTAQLQPSEAVSSRQPGDRSLPHGTTVPNPNAIAHRQSLKRSHEVSTSSDNESLQEGAHSVAVNLGMLSLNSDSSQKHYLGSSSGLLFSNLIGASPSSQEATPDPNKSLCPTAPDSNYPPTVTGSAQLRLQSLQPLLKQVRFRKWLVCSG